MFRLYKKHGAACSSTSYNLDTLGVRLAVYQDPCNFNTSWLRTYCGVRKNALYVHFELRLGKLYSGMFGFEVSRIKELKANLNK